MEVVVRDALRRRVDLDGGFVGYVQRSRASFGDLRMRIFAGDIMQGLL